jgi:hypothetical protein
VSGVTEFIDNPTYFGRDTDGVSLTDHSETFALNEEGDVDWESIVEDASRESESRRTRDVRAVYQRIVSQ